jgi:hypothetical protein
VQSELKKKISNPGRPGKTHDDVPEKPGATKTQSNRTHTDRAVEAAGRGCGWAGFWIDWNIKDQQVAKCPRRTRAALCIALLRRLETLFISSFFFSLPTLFITWNTCIFLAACWRIINKQSSTLYSADHRIKLYSDQPGNHDTTLCCLHCYRKTPTCTRLSQRRCKIIPIRIADARAVHSVY